MIVLDASAAVDWLLQTPAGRQIETRIYSQNETLHTVHLLDLEVAQVLRRLLTQGTVTTARADQALQDLLDLRITRYAHFPVAESAEGDGAHDHCVDEDEPGVEPKLGASCDGTE